MAVLQDDEPASLEAARASDPVAASAGSVAGGHNFHPPSASVGARNTTKSSIWTDPNGNSITAPNLAAIAGKKTPAKLSRTSTAAGGGGGAHRDADDNLGASSATPARAAPPPPPPPSMPSPSPANSTAIDPLSQHIFMRTNTDHSIPSRLRHTHVPRPDSPQADGLPRPSSDLSAKFNTPNAADTGRDKKKSGSFLSRLSMRGSKRKDNEDSESEVSEQRLEGTNAMLFASNTDAAGYIPIHKEPPRYIKIKAHNKKHKEFDRMFLAQELVGTRPPKTETELTNAYPVVTVSVPGGGRKRAETGGAIWASEFSRDGRYFAVAGRDKIVRIWAVITTPEERKAHESDEVANGATGERLSAPVFREKPVCELEGHTGEVLDISWSKNNFLLSTSMDKTVRLWHMSRAEALCTFKHKELVSKVAFHPTDDRFFLAGSLDASLRLWSIPDKSVAYSAQLTDLITAVAFSPDGKTAIAGLLTGVCTFYETEGLKLQAQMHVRSSRGKNAKGSKITGIQTIRPPNANEGDAKLLITSTDSRIRVYNLRDKSLEMKLKGHEHSSSQLHANFSDDGAYIICGSEDRKAFIWETNGLEADNKDKRPCEYFNAHSDVVTTAVFAPTLSRQLLGSSGDPIYDLCNPPPVTLMSVEETATSRPPSDEQLSGGEQQPQQQQQSSVPIPTIKKPEESPAYIARSTHYDGNIIVTTDDMGIIKVFRQDCAWAKRKHETWETGSTFSRKIGGASSGLIGRSASILTRTSQGSAPHSRRASLSHPFQTSSPQLGAGGTGHDRILSWRQGIVTHGGRPVSMIATTTSSSVRGSERSVSPSKPARLPLSSSAAATVGRQPVASSPLATIFTHNGTKDGRVGKGSDPMSPLSGTFSHLSLTKASDDAAASVTVAGGDGGGSGSGSKNILDVSKSRAGGRTSQDTSPTGTVRHNSSVEGSKKSVQQDKHEPTQPPTPSFSFRPADAVLDEEQEEEDHLRLDPAGASYSFWNLNRWKGIAGLRASISSSSDGATPSGQHARSSSDATPGERDASLSDHRRKSIGSSLFPKMSSPLTRGDSSSSIPSMAAVSDGGSAGLLSPHGGGAGGGSRGRSPYSQQRRVDSIVSRLSSELTSEEEDREGTEWQEMRCVKCGGKKFKAKRVEGVAGVAGRQKLCCGRCGKVVDE